MPPAAPDISVGPWPARSGTGAAGSIGSQYRQRLSQCPSRREDAALSIRTGTRASSSSTTARAGTPFRMSPATPTMLAAHGTLDCSELVLGNVTLSSPLSLTVTRCDDHIPPRATFPTRSSAWITAPARPRRNIFRRCASAPGCTWIATPSAARDRGCGEIVRPSASCAAPRHRVRVNYRKSLSERRSVNKREKS